jgi:hypothetical protein
MGKTLLILILIDVWGAVDVENVEVDVDVEVA